MPTPEEIAADYIGDDTIHGPTNRKNLAKLIRAYGDRRYGEARDAAAKVSHETPGDMTQKTNDEEAAEIERELMKLSERASRLSGLTSRSTRHRWNRVWSNINSAIVGCREIIGASGGQPGIGAIL